MLGAYHLLVRLGQAQPLQFAKSGAALRLEQGVPGPGRRVIAITGLGDNIIVTGQNQRLLIGQKRLGMGL